MEAFMNKIAVLFLAAGLYGFYATCGIAAVKDSAWLSSEAAMISTIEQASSAQPVGMILIWPSAQALPYGWLECNGQAVDETEYPEYAARFGKFVPDYRGFFLRGYGGNSGALGVSQDYALETNGTSGIKVYGFGNESFSYVSGVSYKAPVFNDKSNEKGISNLLSKMYDNIVQLNEQSGLHSRDLSDTVENLSKSPDGKPGNGSSITSGSVTAVSREQGIMVQKAGTSLGDGVKLEITSDAGETRPVNKAVRYIVKVK